jgi:hypothetical protein
MGRNYLGDYPKHESRNEPLSEQLCPKIRFNIPGYDLNNTKSGISDYSFRIFCVSSVLNKHRKYTISTQKQHRNHDFNTELILL